MRTPLGVGVSAEERVNFVVELSEPRALVPYPQGRSPVDMVRRGMKHQNDETPANILRCAQIGEPKYF